MNEEEWDGRGVGFDGVEVGVGDVPGRCCFVVFSSLAPYKLVQYIHSPHFSFSIKGNYNILVFYSTFLM